MGKSNLITIPKKVITIIIIVIVSLFVFFIYMSNKSAVKYIEADFKTEIKPIELNGSETYGNLRGGLFFEKNKFLSTSAKLIVNSPIDRSLWESHGPLVDFDNISHHYTLDDLSLPFFISKQSDNDTITVTKNGITLKFIMDLTHD